MSAPTKQSINLGNETHARGFNDGLNGRPKTIKKTHAHAHRYHIGYRLGDQERKSTMRAAMTTDFNGVATASYKVVQTRAESKPVKQGLLSRIWGWIRS